MRQLQNKFMLVPNKDMLIRFVHFCQNTWQQQCTAPFVRDSHRLKLHLCLLHCCWNHFWNHRCTYTITVFLIFLLFSIFTSYIIKITQPWAVIVATVVSNSKQQWFPNQKTSICPNLPAPVHPSKVQKCVPPLSNIETCWKIL